MTALCLLPRRALCTLGLAALVAVPAACGGDDDTSADPVTTTTVPAEGVTLSECGERFVEVTRREDVVDAVRTEAEALPADAEAAFVAVDEECGDELDALVGDELDALIAAVDPEVLDYITRDAAQEFEKTGDTIAGLDG